MHNGLLDCSAIHSATICMNISLLYSRVVLYTCNLGTKKVCNFLQLITTSENLLRYIQIALQEVTHPVLSHKCHLHFLGITQEEYSCSIVVYTFVLYIFVTLFSFSVNEYMALVLLWKY